VDEIAAEEHAQGQVRRRQLARNRDPRALEPTAGELLARDQKVSAASASAMVKKLAALDLLEHEPYRGFHLTPAGEKVALEVIRHHRLIELYLAETLGLHVDDVHDEADRLEHVISEELEERIDQALGFPTHDPHGDPIPNAELEWPGERERG
jgi:DtxR family Mn-dependent transcriptional regulator